MKKSQLCGDLEEQCSKQKLAGAEILQESQRGGGKKCAGRRGGQVTVGEGGAGAK